MKNTLIQYAQRLKTGAYLLLFAFLSSPVLAAGLPKMEDPSRGQGKGIFQTLQNYLYDGVILIGLVISSVAFIAVAWHGVSVFGEVQKQKKSWADLGLLILVGGLLIVACIWLLTEASKIL